MKKNGFTLVEVLAVIVILGVIVTLVYPAVISAVKSSEEKAYDNQKEIIVKAAKMYYLDNVNLLYYYIYSGSSSDSLNGTLYTTSSSNENIKSFDEYCEGLDSNARENTTINATSSPLSIETLINSGYIADEELDNGKVINPKTSESLEGNIVVKWSCKANQYEYTFEESSS